ncbi:MAG: A/G-specific adenine glycosylase [Phycisphaerae bacterium]
MKHTVKTNKPASALSLKLPKADIDTLRRRLLRWFSAAQRKLPWRQSRDPYAIWLSEVMLQQTQVATVIPYYNTFLTRFPDIRSLARADITDVLTLWAGLGYYRRAHQLHAAARDILNNHGGVIPTEFDRLLNLPGFGPYTAGAVASIAFGQRVPAVDGNVLRVMTRLLADPRDIRRPAVQQDLRRTAETWIPPRRAGDFNQALMELGATICTPRNPRCLRCPLSTICRGHRNGDPAQFPRRGPTVDRRTLYLAAIAVTADRGELLMARRRSPGLWAGLWELPSITIPGPNAPPVREATRLADAKLGIHLAKLRRVSDIVHTLTHRHITVWIYRGRVASADRRRGNPVPAPKSTDYAEMYWAAQVDELPLSVMAEKQLSALRAAEADIPAARCVGETEDK